MAAVSGGRELAFVCVILFSLLTLRANSQTTIDVPTVPTVPSGVLEGGNVVDIPTRVGCPELISCLGNGTMDPQWRRFSLRTPLALGDNRMIISTPMDPDMDGIYSYVSNLTFNPIRLTDTGSFVCIIDSIAHTVRIRVDPDYADVQPGSLTYDLSDRELGSNMTVLCSVESCIPQLTLILLQDGEVLKSVVRDFPPGTEHQFNLKVTNSRAGKYECRVRGEFVEESFTAQAFFNITGTPLPPATAPPPTTSPPSLGASESPSMPGGGAVDSLRASSLLLYALSLAASILLVQSLVTTS